MQMGPGIEMSMRNRMIEMQREVSNRTLRSAAATRQAKPGSLAGLRAGIGTRRSVDAGEQLASIECDSRRRRVHHGDSVLDDSRSSKQLPSIELAILSDRVLEALIAGSIDRASAAFGRPLPPSLLEDDWLWNYRLDQMREDPASCRWLVRVVIDAESRRSSVMPDFTDHRTRTAWSRSATPSIPTFAAGGMRPPRLWRALIAYATNEPGVTTVRASISPDNAASLATIARSVSFRSASRWTRSTVSS